MEVQGLDIGFLTLVLYLRTYLFLKQRIYFKVISAYGNVKSFLCFIERILRASSHRKMLLFMLALSDLMQYLFLSFLVALVFVRNIKSELNLTTSHKSIENEILDHTNKDKTQYMSFFLFTFFVYHKNLCIKFDEIWLLS